MGGFRRAVGGSPLPAGGDPSVAAAARPGDPRTRRAAVLTPRCRWPGLAPKLAPSSSRQPSCRRAQITVKGARVADAMGASAHP